MAARYPDQAPSVIATRFRDASVTVPGTGPAAEADAPCRAFCPSAAREDTLSLRWPGYQPRAKLEKSWAHVSFEAEEGRRQRSWNSLRPSRTNAISCVLPWP